MKNMQNGGHFFVFFYSFSFAFCNKNFKLFFKRHKNLISIFHDIRKDTNFTLETCLPCGIFVLLFFSHFIPSHDSFTYYVC